MREEIAKIVPFYDGFQHLKKTGDAYQYGGPHLCADWKFPTADGKAHFRVVALPPMPVRQSPGSSREPAPSSSSSPRTFILSTRRGKQFNTLIYDEIDPLTGAGRDAIFMNPEDSAELHLINHDRVALINEIGRLEGRIFFAPIARGNLQVHWPEGNVIIQRGVVDSLGGVPDYNARVKVEKIV